MENTQQNFKVIKEVKRHKSAIIPPGPIVLNNCPLKDSSDNGSNNTNSTTCKNIFKLKSNSIFAYQEFDKFSSFCDNENNELNDDKLFINESSKKNISNINEDIYNNKDELNNTASSYSLKEFIDQINNNSKKRKSAFDSMPPYFAQYLGLKYQNGEVPNLDNNNNVINNIINNQFANGIRRTHTEKQNKNFINAFFRQINNFKNNNKETIPDFENRRGSQGFVPMYNNLYNVYFPNFNPINNFNNMFYLNNTYNGNGSDCSMGDNQNCQSTINNMEKNDFPATINEFPENFRKKSNSLKINPMYSQINQFKMGIPYQSNNFNLFSLIPKNNFKNKNHLNNNNNIIKNNHSILYIFQEQSNCRCIQEQLELHKNDMEYIQNFFEQIKSDLVNITEHQFGNYVIQKFLEILIYQENKILNNKFINTIDKNDKLYEISINNYGTRVIQKTLEKLVNNNYSKIETPELNKSIINLIENHLYDLCCDKNGNHVYQKLLKVFYYEKENKNDFLYNYLSDISLNVALLQQGATIFGTALSLCNYKQKEKICLKILENIEKLINDKYGNYSLQAIINKLKDEKNLIEPIYLYIENNIVQLSKQKCSSNVVDTFIMKKDNYSLKLVEHMIKNNLIKDIIKDQYGNYVVQKAMHISDEETVNKIIEQIKPIIPELLESNIGKKIYEKLIENYNDRFNKE